MKICVYAICKNEEAFAQRWMASVKEADMVIVTDTGSTDGTVALLRAAGAVVYEERVTPWRFDTARNLAMDHVPEDAEICVSNDLDEVFEPGWRAKLEAAWTPAHTRARYTYTWSHHPDGTPEKQFPMEKIHRRQGFRWVHPVHEVLEYTGEDADNTLRIPELVLHHYPDAAKPRGQYLPLLELSAAENPQDDRTLFWLGREYWFHRRYSDCIGTLKRHLTLPAARWDEERSASMRFIAAAYQAQGDAQAAKSWLFRAIAACPRVREPYLKLAYTGYAEGNWPLVYAMTEKALAIPAPTGSYLSEPGSWNHAPYELGAISAYRLGLYAQSRVYAIKALALKPDDARLQNNLRLIEADMPDARKEAQP